MSSPDLQFAARAAEGGYDEVAAAKLALQKTQNPDVRAFAERMIHDHTANNAKLASVVRGMGMAPAMHADANGRAMMAKLQGLSGAAFDRAYLAGQVAGHSAMQILLQSEINGGKNAQLIAYAKATLPTVNDHLNMAKGDVAMMKSGTPGSAMSSGSMSGDSMGGNSMSSGSMSGGSSMGSGAMNGGAMPNGSAASPAPAGSAVPR